MTELRGFLRASAEYQIEYGPFPPTGRDRTMKTGAIRNIGGGGLMFRADEPFPVDSQLVLRIYITGWRQEGDDLVEGKEDEVAPVTAIAQVTRSEYDANDENYRIGVKFLGRILD